MPSEGRTKEPQIAYNVIKENTSNREITDLASRKNLNDFNKLKILNETFFEEMRQNNSFSNQTVQQSPNYFQNVTLERPRTPPIATEVIFNY